MHEYDVALKRILTRPGSALLFALTGCVELRWLNVELPRVNNLRVDLLGAMPDGGLIQFEFQSRNEKGFALRMAEYAFAIARQHGRFPRQTVIYVGERPLRMKSGIASEDLTFRFHLVDIRELDGEPLLASRNLSDNVLAVLTRLGDRPGTVRRVLQRIADAPAEQRGEAIAELSILAGLRRLTGEIKREAKKMPIAEDIMDNPLIGPLIRKGLAKGIAQGRVQGRIEGQMEILTEQIEKRFGSITPRTRKRLTSLKPNQLKAVGLRLLDAESIADLFAK